MDCVKPVLAWKCGTVRCKCDGQTSVHLVFSGREAEKYFRSHFGPLWPKVMSDNEMLVPCGKCPNCVARKRALQSIRLCHERSMHDNACFITLTYDEEHVPVTDTRVNVDPNKHLDRGISNGPIRTLYPKDVQDFIKRLRGSLTYQCTRKKVRRDHVDRIRYFLVGEYGSKTHRPHYHLIVFGWFPSDAVPWRKDDFLSAQIARLWPHGFHTVSKVTEGRCKYAAQYVTKKMVKKDDPFEGRRCPEFIRQSVKNGGIGVPWFHRYAKHCAAVGYVTYRSGNLILKSGMPPSYVRHLRKYFPDDWLAWRDRCTKSVRVEISPEDALARARLNEIRFQKSLDREIL